MIGRPTAGLRRAVVGAAALCAVLVAVPALAQSHFAGRPLMNVLAELQRAGLKIVYSSELVDERMTVAREPEGRTPREQLDEVLRPHGLAVRSGPGETLVVVRTNPEGPRAPASQGSEGPGGRRPGSGVVRGRVVEARTGTPLPGVTVGVGDASARLVTDADGRFELRDLPPGRVSLFVSLVGYALARPEVEVTAGAVTEVMVPLADGTGAYTETVQVAGDAFGRRDPATPAQLSLTSAELQDLRGVIADDPLRAVQALPAVATGDDFRSEFSVRGSDYRHMGLSVDGIASPWLVHGVRGREDTGSVSIVNGDVLGRVTLEPGVAPQVHPGRTGGWLALDLRDGSRARAGLRASVSGSSASAVAEGPLGDAGRGSWIVSGRQSYLQWLFRQLDLEDTPAFGFTDAQARFTYDTSPTQQLHVTVVAGTSRLEEDDPDPGPNGLAEARSDASLVTAGWDWQHGTTAVAQRVAASHDGFRNTGFFDQELGRGSGGSLVYAADARRPLGGAVLLQAGTYVERRHDDQVLRQFRRAGSTAVRTLELPAAGRTWTAAGFAGATWAPGPDVTIDAGLRTTRDSRLEAVTHAPWLIAAWRVSDAVTLRGGIDGARQLPDFDRITSGATGELPRPERARLVDVGMEQRLGSSWRWQVTAWMREERDMLRQQDAETRLVAGALVERDPRPAWRNTLDVSARGVEVLVQRRAATGVSGWIGYAYGRSRAHDRVTGESYWADFDQRHALNAYATARLSTRTALGVRLRIGSNFPVPGYFRREGLQIFLAESRNEVRLPVYARLDLRASRAFNYRTRRLTLFVELLNVLNRTNYGPTDGTIRQSTREAAGYVEKLLPFVPSAGFTIEF
ncbi:MAG: TonB-dependent receptor [Vicinamibacterales bacterium]